MKQILTIFLAAAGSAIFSADLTGQLMKPEYSKIPLGGDSIHTRDAFQAHYIGVISPDSTTSRAKGIGGYRAFHMRHLGKGNLFYADGHVATLGRPDLTPETYITYAVAVAGPSVY